MQISVFFFLKLDTEDLRGLSQLKHLTELRLFNIVLSEPLLLPTDADQPLVSLKEITMNVILPRSADQHEYMAAIYQWFPSAQNVNIRVVDRFGEPDDEESDEETDEEFDDDTEEDDFAEVPDEFAEIYPYFDMDDFFN